MHVIDCQLSAHVHMRTLPVPAWTTNLALGASAWDRTHGLDGSTYILSTAIPMHAHNWILAGLLDELVIWNRSLSAAGMRGVHLDLLSSHVYSLLDLSQRFAAW
jgi:hypothetical protein